MNVVPMKTAGALILVVTLLGGIEHAVAEVVFSQSVPDAQTGCVAVNDSAFSETGNSVYFCVDPIVPDGSEVFFGGGIGSSKPFSDLVIVSNPSNGPMTDDTVSVDEPGTISLLGLGLFAVGLLNRRKRSANDVLSGKCCSRR